MSAYLLLAAAIVSEVFAEAMMKLSNGFEKKVPIIGIAIGYLIAFYLMAQTLNELPLGFVYAVWTGAGVALTAIIGAIVWDEGFNAKKAIGIAAIIVGVVFLKIGV
ncbi:DMT family transporter [Raoultibacter timonensis]|uniref:Multidrug resistance protein EbrB n=1 Tax=Raoultibacter timonensis TaxID=1907662 RepID=A0ABN6MHV9_9ACTN|nr:multidrug efflux SMR transporter [Raoultibacter timonensis]BDE97579.1 multidrug resistance protein EbrB [Raoultibacter timonensis]BDF52182.1 multidrug resistance protein EbrB [Raoultibacter timonensis]